MRKSIATVSLSGTLEEKLAAAAHVGFDGIELFENDLITSTSSPVAIRRRAADLGIGIDLYQPFRDFEGVGEEAFRRNVRRAERKFAVMAELGASLMLVCSNVSAAAIDDDSLAAAQLHELAARAAEHGIRVAYEALAWGTHVSDYRHAWRIVAAAEHPGLGVCLDSFHILSRDDDPGGIRDLPGDKIFYVQLSDAPALRMDVLQWSRHYRCFPGQGAFDLEAFCGHVLATSYSGPFSLEVFNDVLRHADAERTATDAMRSLIVLEDALARRGTATPAVGEPLPGAAGPTGYAFVELAVDARSEAIAERVLACLGFARAGRHRSKPVRLWRQGDARILLNRAHPTAAEWTRGTTMVSAIGVESPDPGASAGRAAALLALPVPRNRGPGEADLSAVAAPDGSSVFFCRTAADDPGGWLADFTADRQAEPPQLTHIDHVALAQPFHSFDEAVLFYRAVLGLLPQAREEIAEPYGLMRSRAVSNDEFRFVLNVPTLGPAGARTSQHIAFACRDILTVARRLRARGLPVVAIPANYYEDLRARTALDDQLIDTLDDLDILYDADARGHLFHFYTTTVGDHVFFEVLQRVDGYDGYGAANAAVRMAAQAR